MRYILFVVLVSSLMGLIPIAEAHTFTKDADVPEGADLWLKKSLLYLDPDQGRKAVGYFDLSRTMLDAYLVENDSAYLSEYVFLMNRASNSVHSMSDPDPIIELELIYELQESAILLKLHLLDDDVDHKIIVPLSDLLIVLENKKNNPRMSLLYSEGSFDDIETTIFDSHMSSMNDYAFLFSSSALKEASDIAEIAEKSRMNASMKKQFASSLSLLEQGITDEREGRYFSALNLAIASKTIAIASIEGLSISLESAIPFSFEKPADISLETAHLPGL